MGMRMMCVWLLMLGVPLLSQEPATKDVKGFVLTIDETKLVVSNLRVGGPGQTFVMPAPKDGSAGTWVAASGQPTADKPRMVMMTTDDKSPLQLTELTFKKGAYKPSEFPVGTEIVASYRENGGTRTLIKLERAKKAE